MFVRKNQNTLPALSFSDAYNSRAKPAVIQEALRTAMNDPDLWAALEPFLLPPGVCGSKAYDQANVIRNILEWDDEHGGKIAGFGMSDRVLWNYVYRELSKVFDTSQGRVVGLLTDQSDKPHKPDGNGNGHGNGGDVE